MTKSQYLARMKSLWANSEHLMFSLLCSAHVPLGMELEDRVKELKGEVVFRGLSRSWYYFRVGYGTYLTFLLGYLSTLITVYYLAIKNIPSLLDIFPKFLPFALLATIIGGPLSVAIGWVHLKRSRLFSSEADIGVEANPYNYKLAPGYVPEVLFPSYLTQLRILKRMAEANGFLSESERAAIEDLEKKFSILLRGGTVGKPRRDLNF